MWSEFDDPRLQQRLLQLDAALGAGAPATPALFEGVPLDLFAVLQLERPDELPHLKRLFPAWPPVDLQTQWVGSSGRTLLVQSVQFVRTLAAAYERHGRGPIGQARVLDYGCGWGRLLRLMTRFVPEQQLFGVDAWGSIIDLARTLGVRGHLAAIDELPQSLPLPGPVDLVYAFSIFTHLSARAQRHALAAIHRAIEPGGVLVVTIRPVDYWRFVSHPQAEALSAAHRAHGFAFTPLVAPGPTGDAPYGDTSMSIDHIERNWTDWRLVDVDYNLVDPMQLIVILTPRAR